MKKRRVYWLNGKYVPIKELDRTIKKDRAWHVTVYDLQGGPVPEEAINELDELAIKLSKKYNLAINRSIV